MLSDHFDDFNNVSVDKGLNVAISLTSMEEQEPELDPSYGKFQFRINEWGENEDGSFMYETKTSDGHFCSKAELGLDADAKDEALFMPIFRS